MGKYLQNKYKITEEIGSGAFGKVYRGIDMHLGREVAIKEQNDKTIDLLGTEAEILKELHHPMLPEIYDYFYEDKAYLVMEYFKGESLLNYVGRNGYLKEKEAIGYIRALCELMLFLHTQNPPVIYRDLKPENIMITGSGKMVLIDFGTAVINRIPLEYDTSVAGTVGYGAPEQFGYGGEVISDEASDIYSLGAVFYYMVTGFDPSKPPYGVRWAGELNPEVSEASSRIIRKCTHRDRKGRYVDVTDVLADIDRIGATNTKLFIKRILFGSRDKSFILKNEKRICFSGKSAGLLFLSIFMAVIFFGKDIKLNAANDLDVEVYSRDGAGQVIKYGCEYSPNGSFYIEIPEKELPKGSHKQLRIVLSDRVTRDEKERIILLSN